MLRVLTVFFVVRIKVKITIIIARHLTRVLLMGKWLIIKAFTNEINLRPVSVSVTET